MMAFYDEGNLPSLLNQGGLVLRLSDSTSLSPLNSRDGFTATSSSFNPPLSVSEWQTRYQGLRTQLPRWSRKPDVDSVIRHVTGGWPEYHNYRAGSSIWISTTRDLSWAIWEIARRISVLGRGWVDLSVIRGKRRFAAGFRGAKPVCIDAEDVLSKYARKEGYTDDLDKAIYFARASSEMLWLGMVFEKDVLETSMWTATEPGFIPPEEFMIPIKHRHGERWTDWLLWDPNYDSHYDAMEKVDRRSAQLQSSRGQGRK